MSNDFKVLVVELQSSDGTRYALNGMEVDESPLRFNDGEERTIGSLKEKINSVFFRAEPRPLGFIKVYSYPSAAAASTQPWTPHTQWNEALREGRLYGFVDFYHLRQIELSDGELLCFCGVFVVLLVSFSPTLLWYVLVLDSTYRTSSSAAGKEIEDAAAAKGRVGVYSQ